MNASGLMARLKTYRRIKLALAAWVATGFTAIYLLLQYHPAFPITPVKATALDRVIPFTPGAVYLYESLWLLMPIGLGLLRSKDELYRYSKCFFLISMTSFSIFFFFPTSSPRPAGLHDVHGAYGALIRIDKELNAFPSLHVALAVMCGACLQGVIRRAGRHRSWTCLGWAWVAGIIGSTLLTKQHGVIDVLGGVAVGTAGYWLAWRGAKREPELGTGRIPLEQVCGQRHHDGMDRPPTASPFSQSRVVAAACPSYSGSDVAAALAEVMTGMGGMGSFIRAGQTVLVKPNLFSPHAPEDAVTTHPEIVRQVVQMCFEAGAGRVWVGDSPVGTHGEIELWERTGMTMALAGSGAELRSWHVKQIALACESDVLAVPEWFEQVDVIVSLPKLKTHCLTTLTCGLKNTYGLVTGQAKAQFHTKYPSPESMSAFLVKVFAVFRPQLTIADAIVAMEGNGPAHGSPLPLGILLTSRDAVALDAIACGPLGVAPKSVPMIRMAAAKGLGVAEAADIEIMGSGLPLLRAARMKPSLSKFLKLIPEWAYAKRLRLFRMRPNIRRRLCIKCGTCAKACPRGAIDAHTRAGYPAIDKAACIDCFCCLESCPQSAIAVQYSLGGLFSHTRPARTAKGQS